MSVYARGASLIGLDALEVGVEVHLSTPPTGESVTRIVGVPDTIVRESRERVRAAIWNSGFRYPTQNVLINLAPATVRKTGASFDLPIALGILAAAEQIPRDRVLQFLCAGELSLSGDIRPTRGVLPIIELARDRGRTGVIALGDIGPYDHEQEGTPLLPGKDLREVIAFLRGKAPIAPQSPQGEKAPARLPPDLADVRGQRRAKTAVVAAAAGGHNLLFLGTPGTGKTMLIQRLIGILPPPTHREEMDIARIHSIAGISNPTEARPFRAPHHTVSYAGLVGGGNPPIPGEITLAHHGILFLDELPEFPKRSLETLRSPLEEGCITLSRAGVALTYPCRFQFAAAMNPCPCGYRGHPVRACRCALPSVNRYLDRVSGPILDRIDIQVEVGPLRASEMRGSDRGMDSTEARNRVCAARERQAHRFRNESFALNAEIPSAQIEAFACIEEGAAAPLHRAMDAGRLSARAYVRVLRVARTLADLEDAKTVSKGHIATAVGLRYFDAQSS